MGVEGSSFFLRGLGEEAGKDDWKFGNSPLLDIFKIIRFAFFSLMMIGR